MDNPNNLGVYDINAIADYDPEIVEFLERGLWSEYELVHSSASKAYRKSSISWSYASSFLLYPLGTLA